MNVLGTWSGAVIWAGTLALFFVLHDGILIQWSFFAHWPVWYRQRGPGADPSLINTLLRSVKLGGQSVKLRESRVVTMFTILLLLWVWPTLYLQRLTSMILFVPYALLKLLEIRFPKGWGGLLRPKMFILHDAEWRISDICAP